MSLIGKLWIGVAGFVVMGVIAIVWHAPTDVWGILFALAAAAAGAAMILGKNPNLFNK